MRRPVHPRSAHPIVAAIILLTLVPAFSCSIPSPEPKADPPQNLILISIDTLRAGHLGSYGYTRPTSPKLDAFAAGGTVFRQTISSSSWTVPAHTTLFTGLEPPAHQLVDFPDAGRLASEHVTLAEILRDAGFRTGAFTGGGFMSGRFGFDDGFEVWQSAGRRFYTKIAPVNQWIGSLEENERFFLFLHGFDAHRPYRPPPVMAAGFRPETDVATQSDESIADRLFPLLEDLAVLVKNHPLDTPVTQRPSDEEIALIISQYDGEIRFVDELLGGFMGWLDSVGRLENTLVVVVSDHGDEFYEHGAIDHVHTLYDELLQVAWFMVGPNVPAGVVDRQVGLVDVLPTVLDLLGIESPEGLQGVSRTALMTKPGGVTGPTDDLGQAVYSYTGFSRYPYEVASVRTPAWKLVRWSLAGMADIDLDALPTREHYTHLFRSETEELVELFDLANDPQEQVNVAADHAEIVQRYLQSLDQRIATGRTLGRGSLEARPPDEQELEQLRSLGYVE